ncbi:MAG: type II secretion system protein [Candidatus Paceibacterota bacterium]|jgi:prepilin-type N-terminal cleavage/methylation domain-containing protein
MTKLNKGFTLIELLVVIAIIGILSGLIIVSMSSATRSANDARVQAGADQMRSAAMLYAISHSNLFNANGTTAIAGATDCTAVANTFLDGVAGNDAQKVCADIINYDTGTPIIRLKGDGTVYCAAFDLQAGTVWCVDSTGFGGAVAAVENCDATSYDCAP